MFELSDNVILMVSCSRVTKLSKFQWPRELQGREVFLLLGRLRSALGDYRGNNLINPILTTMYYAILDSKITENLVPTENLPSRQENLFLTPVRRTPSLLWKTLCFGLVLKDFSGQENIWLKRGFSVVFKTAVHIQLTNNDALKCPKRCLSVPFYVMILKYFLYHYIEKYSVKNLTS